jgi:hypothetical protein
MINRPSINTDLRYLPSSATAFRVYSAACAFTSADTWRIARASISGGCAPDTAYLCAKT